ncbi:MAG TPA: hypothetical protein VGD46_02805 [Rhizobacter sp.]
MSIPPSSERDEWQSTRAETAVPTQVQPRDEDEGDAAQRDIGRPVGPTQRELFVSCDPAEAMQQQLDHLLPEYIALHDIGTSSSRKLLAGVASASGRPVQKLVIRRQGFGTPLAALEFVDFPSAGGASLRLYTTETDADTHQRHELARVLLCYSRLGVIMVGDLPPHLMASSFEPLREAMIKRDWHNRHMLLLPLAHSTTLGSTGTDLGRGTGVTVRTTPQVTRPADAWSFISGTWNRLREQIHAEAGLSLPPLPGATRGAAGSEGPVSAPTPLVTEPGSLSAATPAVPPAAPPMAMKPMPTIGAREPQPDDGPLARYVHQLIQLPGMVSVAIFDTATGQAHLHAGARPGGPDLGQHGAALLGAMAHTSRTLGMGHALPEAAITLGTHHLLLRAVPHHPGLALHAVLDKTHANLTLARLQIGRMDAVLDAGDSTR